MQVKTRYQVENIQPKVFGIVSDWGCQTPTCMEQRFTSGTITNFTPLSELEIDL